MQNVIQKNIFYIGAFVDLLVFDQLSKYFIDLNLSGKNAWNAITGFLTIHSSHNPAIAFSLPIPGTLVALFTPLLLAALITFVVKSCDLSKKVTKIALVLLIAGTIGNFIDRVWHGYVIDFIDFSFFPSFNLADSYLTIGVILLIFAMQQKGISEVAE